MDHRKRGACLLFVAICWLGIAVFAVEAGTVVINEIHYNPDIKTELVEFIELHNAGAVAVDLSGWTISSAVDYTFPTGTSIAPGGFAVVAQNTNAFRLKFGFNPLGPWTGSLDNFEDKVVLKNATGQVEDEVSYKLGFPWPTAGDLPGYSIELVNPSFDNDLGANWRASFVAASASQTQTLINDHAPWKYFKGLSEVSSPPTLWREPGFDDSAWLSGVTPIGYGETFVTNTGTVLPDMLGGYTSVFLRKTFVVTNVSQISALTLEAQYDDGFKLWINGTNVIDGQANMPGGEVAYNDSAISEIENANYNPFALNSFTNYLRNGTNVIAIQAHNVSISGSSDFYIDIRLKAQRGPAAGRGPTPGRTNSVYDINVPPQIRQVDHSPNQPTNAQVVTITAKVTDADSVTNVTLLYQVVDPGSYIEIADAAYTNNWTALLMNDAGLNGDETAGDDVYTVQLPGSLQVHRRLIRYRILAYDGTGRSIRVPYADDPQPNFAYFVYSGIPEWRGALNGGTQTVFPASVMGRLPTYHLLSKKSSVETATWFERYGGDLYKWNGALVYDGHVYDHIRYRARGGVWRYSMVKNMWKFDFNRGHDFEARDNWGKKFATPWRKLNLGASIQQRDFWHRGEQGMFEAVGFKMFNLAGTEAPKTTFCTFRVIDEAAESYSSNQYEGDFWGAYLTIEQEDGRFLEEHGLPDGNFYKMEGGTGELNNVGPLGPTDKSDLNYFLGNYTAATEAWWRTNLNVPQYLGYQAVVQAIHHYDICYDKNFFYYKNPITGLWQVHSWDLDLTWANNMFDAGCGGVDRIKARLLDGTRPNIEIEWRNRVREVRDLMFNTDQAYRMIDEYAWLLRGPTNGPTILDADRFMWDFNPKMISGTYSQNLGKAGQGEFYQFTQESGTNANLKGSFNAAIQIMKNYVNIRGTFLDNIANDTSIPGTPIVTATAPTNFPLNKLTFRASNYSGGNPFAAMKWRIAEITPTNAPVSALAESAKYEITPIWESADLTAFNSDITIPSDVVRAGSTYRVRCRFKDSTGRWSRWSSPIEFVCGPPDTSAALLANLRVSELMYNSPAGSEYDFIELHHAGGPLSLDLNGAKFTQGIDYTFGPGTIIPPGEYLVLTKTTNIAAFRAYYGLGSSAMVLGGYSGKFDNSGEQVTLRTSAGGTDIASFEYSDGRGWPIAADGAGHSLVPLDSAMNGQKSGALNYGGNWRASTYIRGSPGAADPEIPPTVVLNEVVAHTDFTTEFDSNDWLELHNATDNTFTFGANWFLSDDRTNLTKWMIPSGRIIPAHGFITFDEQTGFHNPTNIGFGLNKAGEEVLLSHLPGGGQDRVVDSVAFKAQENDWSLGRFPDGGAFWYALTPRTRDASNATPQLHAVISELMYHPPDVGGTNDNALDEFIELFNPTAGPIALFNTNGGWRIDGGVSFTFPNVTMPAMGRLLVVNFNPTNATQSNAFRATYGITGSPSIYGPYTSGKLANSSGRVAVEKPQAPDLPDDPVSWVIVDEVIYGDQDPWPLAADGFGPSLHRQDMLRHGSDPANWQAATPTPGGAYGGGTPPTITEQPSPATRTSPAGADITYSVSASGTAPLRYQWRFNGNNLSLETNTILSLSNVQPANSGQYQALILNPAGSVLSDTVTLFVTTPPQISAHPQSRDVRPGSTVTFSVFANGTGVRYQWRSNSVDLVGVTNSTYTITNAQLAHEGSYTVVVSDVNGAVVSLPAVLRILINPVFVQNPLSQTVLVGEDVTFTGAITGNPAPFGYSWRRILPSMVLTNIVSAEKETTFTMRNVSTNDTANYRVVVTNAAIVSPGVTSTSFSLTVLADTDGDGMPDAWETTYSLNPTNAADAMLDADEDGLTNLQEYRAGTNPRDRLSYLKIESIESELSTSGSMRVTFIAVSNRTYTIQYRDSLLPAPWNRLIDVVGATTNRTVQAIDSLPATISKRYYRLATPRLL